MSNAIDGLKPELLWKYFAEISRIPRGSKNEKAISKYVYETAKKLGLEAKIDKVGNVIVRKPASSGKENVRTICLQGHLDMVCEKNKDKVHDFLKDPIELVRKGNVIMANGTTLGADNGVAVATNLAIMEDKTLNHGPLEFLFTIDEETGLTGANNLSPTDLKSKTLLNLDSEEEGEIFVGCSGGKDTLGIWKATFNSAPANHVQLILTAKGLKGGHSGLEIDKNRGNAIKIMNRILLRFAELGARISSINGGNKRNAIPREVEAVVFIPKAKVKKAEELAMEIAKKIKSEISTVEPDFKLEIVEVKKVKKAKVFSKTLQEQVLKTISALPHGVMKMSSDIAGLVETSTNVAIITTDKKSVSIATSQRSSVASEILEIAETVATIFELGGAKLKIGEGYPGWKPNLKSEILKFAVSTYKKLYGKEPAVKAVHAGLECGIIGEKYPGMDMISFGPTLEAVHSPDEKIYIDSVDKYYKFLLEILNSVN